MILSFKTDGASKELTFNDVEEDQFFVDIDGRLCQKGGETFFCMITEPDGTPCLICYNNAYDDMPIERVLPLVDKIEF
jgi:hypothetical protein